MQRDPEQAFHADVPRHHSVSAPAARWHRRVWARLAAHWLLKGIGTTVFMYLFFVGYFHLLNNPVFPVTVMPLTEVDRLVAFEPRALALYFSLWVYVSLPPALLPTRPQLYAYGWAVGGLCLAGMACFFFWPTAIPANDLDLTTAQGFSMLKGIDAAGNAFPSLHVATAVFSGIWLDRQLRDLASPAAARLLSALWCAGIVYSTLATKQHVALDVAGGLALGLVGGVLSLAAFRRVTAVVKD